jgi:transposase InsO family protein
MLSDSEILDLYQDTAFQGSFSGARTFQMFLKTDKNVDISITKIYTLLKQLPLYIMNQKRIRKFPRRKYVVTSFGQVCQADLGEMLPFNKFRYFLLLVDLFSRHLYVEPLRRKTTQVVRAAFEKIFEQFKSPIVKLETDQGSEFISQAKWFKEKKIVYKKKLVFTKPAKRNIQFF